MRVQRSIGLVAAALMLHANAKVALAACVLADPVATTADAIRSHPESHGDHGAPAQPESTHHQGDGTPAGMTASPGEHSGSSDAPAADDCCQEMSSCGSSVILNQGAARTAGGPAAAAAISREAEVLLGRTAEPEPPPPKV